jgi:hypothetical protein
MPRLNLVSRAISVIVVMAANALPNVTMSNMDSIGMLDGLKYMVTLNYVSIFNLLKPINDYI